METLYSVMTSESMLLLTTTAFVQSIQTIFTCKYTRVLEMEAGLYTNQGPLAYKRFKTYECVDDSEKGSFFRVNF